MRTYVIALGVLVLSGLVFAASPGRAQDRPDIPDFTISYFKTLSGGTLAATDALTFTMVDAPTTIYIGTASTYSTNYQLFYGRFSRNISTTAGGADKFGIVNFVLFEPDRIIRNPTGQGMRQARYVYAYVYGDSTGQAAFSRVLTGANYSTAALGCRATVSLRDTDANGSVDEPRDRAFYRGFCAPAAIALLGLSTDQVTLLKKLRLLNRRNALVLRGAFGPS